jgi:hypothetical protein
MPISLAGGQAGPIRHAPGGLSFVIGGAPGPAAYAPDTPLKTNNFAVTTSIIQNRCLLRDAFDRGDVLKTYIGKFAS